MYYMSTYIWKCLQYLQANILGKYVCDNIKKSKGIHRLIWKTRRLV